MASDVLWKPDPEAFELSALSRFARLVGHDPHDYPSLHYWSISEKGEFWKAVWTFTEVIGDCRGPSFVPDPNARMTGASFFPEARLNLAENLLRGPDRAGAVIEANETGEMASYSLADIRARVAKTAAGLKSTGVTVGDRVAGILPNTLDALIALLATASIGAIWSSCSPDFGATAILDRLGQIEPKVLFVTRRYRYGGKMHDISDRLVEIAARMPSLKIMVLSGEGGPLMSGIDQQAMEDFGTPSQLLYERVPFLHPVYVLYTSGTTGAPKAIVHSTGGVLLQHLKEHVLHGDVRPGEAISWYTNTAWMMYHWLISALACGASIVLYDGAAVLRTAGGKLDVSPQWKAAERIGVSHFGTSPKFLSLMASENYAPREQHSLENLRSVLSAGAPVSPAQFDWAYENIKRDMCFASISGGTEIIGCFFLGSPLHPVRRGMLTVKGLGLAANVFDDRNAPVIGQQGDLVCTEPFPSMPVTFWGNGGLARYHNTYFADRREIWTHGDVAELTIHGSAIIYGRSDATLKPGGVRIGTAEIYAACETISDIADCLVFGVPIDDDEEIVLCLKLKDGTILNPELARQIRDVVRHQASPRHVPHRIHPVRDIPYTLNGKRVEGAARSAAQGDAIKNLGSISNPECLDEFRQLDRSKAL